MGLLTYLKIGAAVVLLAVGGFFYWNYHHMQNKIVALQTEIEGLKLRAEIIEKAQKATDEYLKKKTIIQTRVVREKADVDKVVESGDTTGMRDLFIKHRLLDDNRNDPKGRPKGNS